MGRMRIRQFVRFVFFSRAAIVATVLLVAIPGLHGLPLFSGFTDLDGLGAFWVSVFAALMVSAILAITNLSMLYGEYRLFGTPPDRSALKEFISYEKDGVIPAVNGPLLQRGLNTRRGGMVSLAGLAIYLWFAVRTMQEEPSPYSYWYFWALGAVVAVAIVFVVTALYIRETAPIVVGDVNIPPGPFLVIPFQKLPGKRRWVDVYRQTPVSSWTGDTLLKIRNGMAAVAPTNWLFRAIEAFIEDFEVGLIYLDAKGMRKILPGHLLAVGLLLVSMALGAGMLIIGGVWQQFPSNVLAGAIFLRTPTLVQVILLLTYVLWLFGGIGYLIDRYPFAIVIAAGAVVGLLSSLSNTDHVFETESKKESFVRPAEVSLPDSVVLVAAAGGGIQAAGWTSIVLDGLRREDKTNTFAKHLALISSVSGGSAGAYFYLLGNKYGVSTTQHDLTDSAMKSSLEVVAWGLAHKDLASLVNPLAKLPIGPGDRGIALERSFVEHAREATGEKDKDKINPLISNSSFAPRADHQKVSFPIWLINSTSASRGRAVVFSNLLFPVPGQNNEAGLLGIDDLASGHDIRLATAVRMSASFPYVSPAARACVDCKSDYLLDGGYYDNYGVVSTITWLRGLKKKPKRILLVKIDAFPLEKETAQQAQDFRYQLIAPLLGLYNARTSGQTNRATQELLLLKESLAQAQPPDQASHLEEITMRYAPEDCECTAQSPPLSWHLTEKEKDCIRKAWKSERAKVCSAYIQRFPQGAVDEPVPEACH